MDQSKIIEEFETRVGLALSGLTMSDLARELSVSLSCVRQVIKGTTKSNKVSSHIEKQIKQKVKITILDQ